MPFNIADFKAQIEDGGVLQTNRYDVAVFFSSSEGSPGLIGTSISTAGAQTTMGSMTKDLTYRCIAASLPGIAIMSSDNNRLGMGLKEKMPFTGAFTDVSLTFLCDKAGAAYKFWYSWINFIFSANGKEAGSSVVNGRQYYTTQYKDSYSSNIEITMYDTEGEASFMCKLYKAFPISMNEVSLGWGDNNNLVKLSIQITFREWAMDDVSLTT